MEHLLAIASVTELSAIVYIVLECHWKDTFDFTEIANNQGLTERTVCQLGRFVSIFSQKLDIQILRSIGSNYYKK